MNRSALALIAAPPDSLGYSLQALLARLPQITSVKSIKDTRSLLAVLKDVSPRLIVLDVNLLGREANPLLASLRRLAPQARTVILVDTIEQQQALQAAAVNLVLLKGYPAAELFASIEQLLARTDPGGNS